tara:strand:- start:511 stop:1233 length:723 start_codon:yes stop_codon:yes gene_type:complete
MNNRFTFVMPTFNAVDTVQYSINSVMMQNYPNTKIVVIDDMSTDGTPDAVQELIEGYGVGEEKIKLIVNTEKKWEVANVLEGMNYADESDIICRLDGDDWLCDIDALAILNYRYETEGFDAIWTAHRWSFTHANMSTELPRDANPYEHPWVSSHLKTFRKKLLSGVSDKNFRNNQGEYYKRIGDQVIYLPALYQAAGNWHFEPIVAYHYSIELNQDTFHTEDAKFQKSESEELRARGFIE